MVIKSLLLENFRRFEKLYLEFPENLVGIIGPNGSGKSTLLEAIGWVLYGNRVVRTDKSEVRSQFAGERDVCRAEMVFEIGGMQYRVRRELRGKNAVMEAAIYRTGEKEPAAVQDSGVNEFVELLLGLDYSSFFASVFARQRDLAALSEMRAEERRRAINRLINIDRIDRAREMVRRDRNEKDAFRMGKESHLKDPEILRNQLGDKKKENRVLQKSVAEAERAVKTLVVDRQQKRKDFDASGKLRDRFNEQQRRIDQLQERKHNRQKEETRLGEEIEKIKLAEKELHLLAPQVEKWQELKNEKTDWDARELKFKEILHQKELLSRLETELERASAQSAALDEQLSEIKSVKSQFEGIAERMAELEQRLNDVQEDESKLRGDIQSVDNRVAEISGHRQTVNELGPESPCPVCRRPLKEHYDSVIRQFEQDLDSLQQQKAEKQKLLAGTKKEVEKIRQELKTVRQQNEEWIRLNSREKEIAASVSRLTEDLENKENERTKIRLGISELGEIRYDSEKHDQIRRQFEEISEKRERVLQLETIVARLPEVSDFLDSTRKILLETGQDLEQAEADRENLGYNEEIYLGQKAALEELERQAEEANQRLAEAKKNLALGIQAQEQLEKEISEQQQLREEIDRLKQEIYYLNLLDEYFGNFRLELAGRIRPLIAQRASELLALTTNSRYSIMELDTDYNIFIYDETERFGIKRFSGGEQDLFSLCLRIAISQVVAERSGGNPLNFIVLDEIFGSQDQERKSLILNAMNQLSHQFRQIFVVTHIEDVKDSLPVLVDVKQSDEQRSDAVLI